MKKPSLFLFFYFFFRWKGVEKVLLAGIDSELSSELSPPQREEGERAAFLLLFFLWTRRRERERERV